MSSSRQHIWSFVSALYEQNPNYETATNSALTITGPTVHHLLSVMITFVITSNPGPCFVNRVYYYDNDPLWDGEGCSPYLLDFAIH